MIGNVQRCYTDNKLVVYLYQGLIFFYLQVWCIPGAVLFNLFAGAVFGTMSGTIYCIIVKIIYKFCFFFQLNTLGNSLIFILSKYLMTDIFNNWNYLCRKKEQIKELMDQHSNDMVFYLIFLRVFPATPNSILNLALPHLGISTLMFSISVLIGLAPWNFFACSSGNLLSSLTSTQKIIGSQEYFQVSIFII